MSILTLISDTLSSPAAAGNIEYNGQFFGTDSNAARGQLQRITQATAVASTSGATITFTDIPAWAKRITIAFQGISTNGTSLIQVQIGAGSVANTGYASGAWTANTSNANSTTGFIVCATLLAGYTFDGVATLVLLNSATGLWSFSSTLANGTSAITSVGGGSKTLSGTLDRVRLTTVGGTETFDAGSINIMYEG